MGPLSVEPPIQGGIVCEPDNLGTLKRNDKTYLVYFIPKIHNFDNSLVLPESQI